MTRKLAELTGPQTLEMLDEESVLVVPIGAVEHHGPHLPLITDALIAESVAHAAVPRTVESGLDAWILPTVSVGKSDEHCWASGTLWLEAGTLFDTLVDLGRSVAGTPARKLVFLNGHGGNVAMLGVALREIRKRFGLMTFAMPAMRVPADPDAPDEDGIGIHGGWAETSMVMHLRADLVRSDHLVRNVPAGLGDYEQIGFNGKPVAFGWLSDDFGPLGIVGDATTASADAGKRIFEHSVGEAVSALAEVGHFQLPARTR